MQNNSSCVVERQLDDQESSDDRLISLYSEAIAQYRQAARISEQEEQLLATGTPLHGYQEKILADWNSFQTPRSSGGKMKDGIRNVLHTMQEKISLIDMVIGFPTQAVMLGS